MFKAIKRLVGIEKREADSIPFNAIDVWFENKLKETDLSKELSEVFNDVSKSLSALAVAVKKIATRKLSNIENIDSIEDYRESFVLKLQSFSKQVTPEKKDVDSILNYGETLSAALSQVGEGTKNHFSIVEKFFPEEAELIVSVFSKLENCQKSLNELIKREKGVLFVNDIKRRILDIKKKNKDSMVLKDQLEKEESKRKETEEYKIVLETDIDNLKTSPEYEKYDQLVSKKLRIEKELERETENMRILFSPVLKMLAEYDKRELGADRALARQYASDPITSLLNDKQLWLLNLLQAVSGKLPEIEQDEKKRLKLRQSILALSEDVLKNYLAKHRIIKEAMSQVQRQITLDNTTMKVEDIKYKLNHVNNQLKIFEENKEKIENTISEINIEKDLLMLEKKLNMLSPVKIQ